MNCLLFTHLGLLCVALLLVLEIVTALSFSKGHSLTIDPLIYNSSRIPFTPHVGQQPMSNYLEQKLNFTSLKSTLEQLRQHVPRPLISRGEAHITVITPPEYEETLQKVGITMEEVNAIALRHRIQENPFRIVCLGRARLLRPNATALDATKGASTSVTVTVTATDKNRMENISSDSNSGNDNNNNNNDINSNTAMQTMTAEEAVKRMQTLSMDVLLEGAPVTTASIVTTASQGKSLHQQQYQYPYPYMEVYYLVVESAGLLAIRQEIAQLFYARGGNSKDFCATTYWPHITVGFTDRDLFVQDGVIKDRSTCWAKIRHETVV